MYLKADENWELIKFLEEDIFLVYNVPRIIISDNGPQFTSKSFQNLLQNYNVNHWLTCRYTPQYNNTERLNRVIMSCIRSYIDKLHNRWDENIHQIACAIRTAVHDTTKYSPYFINYGRNMVTSGDQYEKFIQPPNQSNEEIAKSKSENLKKIMEEVKKAQHKSQNDTTYVQDLFNSLKGM